MIEDKDSLNYVARRLQSKNIVGAEFYELAAIVRAHDVASAKPGEAEDVTDAMVASAFQAYISESGTVDLSGSDDLLQIDDESMRAALSVALAHPRPTGDDHHKAWLAVVDTLNVAAPDWCCDGDDPIQAACAAIRELASPTGEQAGEVVVREPCKLCFGRGERTADGSNGRRVHCKNCDGTGQISRHAQPSHVVVPDEWKVVPTSVEFDHALNEAGWLMVLAYGSDINGRAFNMTKTYLRDAIAKWVELSAAPSPTAHSRDVGGE